MVRGGRGWNRMRYEGEKTPPPVGPHPPRPTPPPAVLQLEEGGERKGEVPHHMLLVHVTGGVGRGQVVLG